MHQEITIKELQIRPHPNRDPQRYNSGNCTLTALINCSLENGVSPDKLKEAFLRPLLKEINLDPIRKNYRSISNLAFEGKLTEGIASKQIILHIDKYNLMEKNQSAYQEYHSTETTLIKV